VRGDAGPEVYWTVASESMPGEGGWYFRCPT
jgi:hypothetical protein